MIEINVKSKRYNCTIQLKQKVTIIIGDSGKGKTIFTKAISKVNEAFKITINDIKYSISELNQNWYDVISYGIDNNIRRIYVVDDDDFIITKEFSHLFSRDKVSYYIFINRFQNINLRSLNRIPFATSEVYSFVANGKEHYLEPFYKYSDSCLTSTMINNIIIEDSNSGKEFFSNLFKGVEIYSTNGKDKVLKYLINNRNKLIYKNTLLIVDLAAFGSWYQAVYEYIYESKLNIAILTKYNSFEYLLLRSNMFNYDFNNFSNDIIVTEVSFEDLCTNTLEGITNEKFYKYTKGNINDCYIRDCCCKNQQISGSVKDICDKGVSGNKFISLLKGTEFESLL